jgi:hypothetical protein
MAEMYRSGAVDRIAAGDRELLNEFLDQLGR